MKRHHRHGFSVCEQATLVEVAWPGRVDRGERCATRIVLPDRTEVYAYRAEDGAWVIEFDTTLCTDEAMGDADDVPYARIYVNDGLACEHSPPEPLAGSREARRLDGDA